MNENQLVQELEAIMVKIGDGPDSYSQILTGLCISPIPTTEYTKLIRDFDDSMSLIRLLLKYLAFDLEATMRERDELRMRWDQL